MNESLWLRRRRGPFAPAGQYEMGDFGQDDMGVARAVSAGPN